MLPLLLAETTAQNATSWLVVGALALLLSTGLSAITFIRTVVGKGSERQVEPTQLAGLQAEIRTNHVAAQAELRLQTASLAKLDREMGGVAASISGFQRDIAEIKVAHTRDIEGVHTRISGISRELASTTAKVEGLEAREQTHPRPTSRS